MMNRINIKVMMKAVMTIIATVMIAIMEINTAEFKKSTKGLRLILPLYKRLTLSFKLRVLKARAVSVVSLKSLLFVQKIIS